MSTTTRPDDMNVEALSRINQQLLKDSARESFPAVTLSDGTKVQTGTVAALFANIKTYDRLCAGEAVDFDRATLEEMLTLAIPTLNKSGFFSIFTVAEWASEKSPGRTFVGKKAAEMGYQ